MSKTQEQESVVFLGGNKVAFVTAHPRNFMVVKYPLQNKRLIVECDGPNCSKMAVSEFHASKKGSTHEIVVYVCDKPDHQHEGEQVALREAMRENKEKKTNKK